MESLDKPESTSEEQGRRHSGSDIELQRAFERDPVPRRGLELECEGPVIYGGGA